MSKYIKPKRSMYRKPFEQLLNIRNNYESYLVYQSPYRILTGLTEWSDFSIFNKEKDIDLRIEVSSLKPIGSSLKYRIYHYARESKHIPEKQLILVLFGDAFDEFLMSDLRAMIRDEKLPIMLFNKLEDFEEFFHNLFN